MATKKTPAARERVEVPNSDDERILLAAYREAHLAGDEAAIDRLAMPFVFIASSWPRSPTGKRRLRTPSSTTAIGKRLARRRRDFAG